MRAQDQVYVRNEGLALLAKLPKEARDTLRHYEMVATTQPFAPLAPLPASGKVGAKAYVFLAVTDWALYVVDKGSSRQQAHDGVLLELPWLWVRDLVRAFVARRGRL